jgi:hypothetical protein
MLFGRPQLGHARSLVMQLEVDSDATLPGGAGDKRRRDGEASKADGEPVVGHSPFGSVTAKSHCQVAIVCERTS